jgi:rRNA maturation protein Nop10
MVVRIRFCPSCGEVLNKNIVSRKCPEDTHVKMRRSRNTYCMDCGAGLLEERRG